MAPVTKNPEQKSINKPTKALASKNTETSLGLQANNAPGSANLRESRYSSSQVLWLQRTVGNRATAQLLGRGGQQRGRGGPVIQAKLAVGPAHDKYEDEADKISSSVMRSPDPVQRHESEEDESEGVQRTPAITRLQRSAEPVQRIEEEEEESEGVQRTVDSVQRIEEEEDESEGVQRTVDSVQRIEEEEDESEGVQRTPDISRIQRSTPVGLEGGPVDGDLERKIHTAQSGGSSLSSGMRGKLEPKLNADLGNVKVHTDTKSVQLNRDLGAKAFTHKNHIFYGAGASPTDMKLTTHEAVHTIQQGAVQQKSVQRRNKGGKNKKES